MNEIDKTFLSTTEAARLLGVSRVTIFNKIKKGELKAVKVGRNFVIAKKDLPDWLISDSRASRQTIEAAVKKAMAEYGETLRLLGKE